MSTEAFGEPTAPDILLEIGLLYERRGTLLLGLRLYFSGVDLDIAEGIVQAYLAEIQDRHGH